MNPHQLLSFIINGYHDGRYVNGHPLLMEWLDSQHVCHIEQLHDEFDKVGYMNVRVWSSVESMNEWRKRKSSELIPIERKAQRESYEREKHPLVLELERAFEEKNLPKVVEIRETLRKNNIRFNNEQTNPRKLL